ncbi:MAG: hypothetical protein AABX32_05560, partial [Nanoarchaeota archaeon]
NMCCGDNPKESYIRGADGSSACCSLPSNVVVNGYCHSNNLCGNNILDKGESCELPDTKNNSYCLQSQQQCLGNKLGIREANGYCNSNCLCGENSFAYSCKKDICGAQCDTDADCGESSKCDLNSCNCRLKTYCGDNHIQNINDYAQKEECELPNTKNNTNCKLEACRDKKSVVLGIADYNYGACSYGRKCEYQDVSYACKIGVCGAGCDESNGCYNGMACNLESCSCYSLSVCGNGQCENGEENICPGDCNEKVCPYRLELSLNKGSYVLNDTINLEVAVYDKNNNLLPEVKFDLDIIINEILAGSSTYSTSSKGSYIIKKTVSNYAPKGIHRYIAKTKAAGCDIVSDTEQAYIYVNNQYTIPPPKINYSRFEFVVDSFDKKNEDVKPVCGNSVIEPGEACENNQICRASAGCSYSDNVYDSVEYCKDCSCPSDSKSNPNDDAYCNSCNHCGDGTVNCGEQCESGINNLGLACSNNMLYNQTQVCLGCKWTYEENVSDNLVDTCECKCPENPKINCVNGNYINYTKNYYAGCSNGKCNSCSCIDTYTKDSNNDGIEDKCSPELCGNNKDDNDNGLVDEKSCILYYCSQCGSGLFNFCTRSDCSKYLEGCYFNSQSFNILNIFNNNSLGNCYPCSQIKTCEEYQLDQNTCINNPCLISNCNWDGKKCCTDKDKDQICDLADNCPDAYNKDQRDDDKDGAGNVCELCPNEQSLLEPSEQKESKCWDKIDNDCDGLADCKDPDCAGILNCCQTANDCKQDACVNENCVNSKCIYEKRELCGNAECQDGQYCDEDGQCRNPDESLSICLFCIQDSTKNDYGIGYGNWFQSPKAAKDSCCGNSADEYYIIQKENSQSACCGSANSCVDYLGKCFESNTPSYQEHNWHCSINSWHECTTNRNALCSEAGSTYKYNFTYIINNETGWYCAYNGKYFGWGSYYPNEVCNDGFDNDCDKKIDLEDADCQKTI